MKIEILAPKGGNHVGMGGIGWIVNLVADFDVSLDESGFSGFQLTGPDVHENVPPFPGTFSTGKDGKFPGLVVLLSSTEVQVGEGGPRQNLANLFNITGLSNLEDDRMPRTQFWDTCVVASPLFGKGVETVLYAAVVADLNGDGIYNDAPNVVPDSNRDGILDEKDLVALGLASNVAKVSFFINP